MTTLSPTALEAAAKAISVSTGDEPDKLTYAREMQCSGNDHGPQYRWQYWTEHATAAITAYLAQAEKEGWVLVPRADIVEVRESMEQMDGTFDPETSDYALYHWLDVLLNPELAGYAAAQNGGE